jgi:mannose-6-phosphate isomerase-like protein (cupin superfamily)
MTEIEQGLTKLKSRQLTIDKLLERGSLVLKEKKGVGNKWVIHPIYQEEDCSLGFVDIEDVGAGPCEPHVHINSKEFLIVIHGSILLNIDGRDVRIVKEGECASIPANSTHYSRPLEDNTRLIYACVPTDRDMFNIPGLEIKR